MSNLFEDLKNALLALGDPETWQTNPHVSPEARAAFFAAASPARLVQLLWRLEIAEAADRTLSPDEPILKLPQVVALGGGFTVKREAALPTQDDLEYLGCCDPDAATISLVEGQGRLREVHTLIMQTLVLALTDAQYDATGEVALPKHVVTGAYQGAVCAIETLVECGAFPGVAEAELEDFVSTAETMPGAYSVTPNETPEKHSLN